MRERLRPAGMVTAIATMSLTCVVACRTSTTNVEAPTVAKAGSTPKTLWGKPDLQGIWSEKLTSRWSGPPSTPTRNSSPTNNAPNSTVSLPASSTGKATKADGRGEPSETSIPNSPRHLTPCIFPSASERRSSSIHRMEGFLPSRRRLNRPATRCASSNSLCCNRRQRARRITPDAPAAIRTGVTETERNASGVLERPQYGWNQPR